MEPCNYAASWRSHASTCSETHACFFFSLYTLLQVQDLSASDDYHLRDTAADEAHLLCLFP